MLGTVGLAATGTLYGALSAGLRVRETLLPFLLLPIAAPVLLAGTRIWQAALAGRCPGRRHASGSGCWWCSTPSTWPSASSSTGPSRSRHEPEPRRSPAHLRPSRARARWTVRIIGIAAAVGTAVTVWLGLWVTPPDQVQGDLVRLVYIHPGRGLGGALPGLRPGRGGQPPLPVAADPLAVLGPAGRGRRRGRAWSSTCCTLISGSIWGKPTWGVWWAWDARLTSTAVLLVLFLGYLALRRVPAEPEVRARRSAFVALFAAVDVPIVHFSVLWWKTLHQGATVLNPDLSPTIHGSMAWTLLLGLRRPHPGLRVDAPGPLPDRRRSRTGWAAASSTWPSSNARPRDAGGPSRSRVDPHDGQPGADGRPDDGVGVGRPVVPKGPDELRRRRLRRRPQHPVPATALQLVWRRAPSDPGR